MRALLALALAFVLVPGARQGSAPDYGIFERYMRQPVLDEAVRLLPQEERQLTLIELSSENPRVRIYWIEEPPPEGTN